MKKYYALFILFFTLQYGLADVKKNKEQNKLIESIQIEKAWSHFNKLTQDIGSPKNGAGFRSITPASDDDKEVVEYILKECGKLNIDVAEESFPVKTYRYELPEIKIGKRKISAISLYGSIGIWGFNMNKEYSIGSDKSRKTLESVLINAGKGTKEEITKLGRIEGRVLIIERDDSTQVWPVVPIIEATKRGAKGIIIYSKENTYIQAPIEANLPVYSVSYEEWAKIQNEISEGRNNIRIKQRVDISNEKTSNLVIYRRGNLFPDESIILGINRDRWFRSAHGSSSGVSALLEIIRVFQKSQYKNNRTIIFVFFGGSLSGGSFPYWHNGSYDFVTKHSEIINKLATFIDLSAIGGADYNAKLSASSELSFFLDEILKKLNLDQIYPVTGSNSPSDISYVFGELSGGSSVKIWRGNGGLELNYRSRNTRKFVSKENLKRDIQFILRLIFEFDSTYIIPYKFSKALSTYIKEFEEDYERLRGEVEIPDVVSSLKDAALTSALLEKKSDEIISDDLIKKIENSSKINSLLFDFRRGIMPNLLALSGRLPSIEVTLGKANPRLRQYREDILLLKSALFALKVNDPEASRKNLEDITSLAWGKNYSIETFYEIVNMANFANKWTKESKQLRYFPSAKIYEIWETLGNKEFPEDYDFSNIIEALLNINSQFEKIVLSDVTYIMDKFSKTKNDIEKRLTEIK